MLFLKNICLKWGVLLYAIIRNPAFIQLKNKDHAQNSDDVCVFEKSNLLG